MSQRQKSRSRSRSVAPRRGRSRRPTPRGGQPQPLPNPVKKTQDYRKVIANNSMRAGGGRVGQRIGKFLGEGYGLGKELFGWIKGSGAYSIRGNSLLTSGPPLFGNRGGGIRVRHREFLTDITSSTAFSLSNYYLNPGLSATFPWLSNIAYNFEQYRFHGLIFEFKTTSATAVSSTNTALGTVVMATDYDDLDATFTNKQQMEAYEFATSTVPCASVIHPVECASRETPLTKMWIRNGPYSAYTTVDPRLYDLGNFQIATVGMQAASVVGELWVSYDVEFFKPKLITPYNGEIEVWHAYGTSVTATPPMATPVTISPQSNLGCTLGGLGAGAYKTISFPLIGRYFLVASCASSTTCSNWPSFTAVSGVTFISNISNSAGPYAATTFTAGSGTSSTATMAFIDVTAVGGTVQLTNNVTLVGTGAYDVWAFTVPSGFQARDLGAGSTMMRALHDKLELLTSKLDEDHDDSKDHKIAGDAGTDEDDTDWSWARRHPDLAARYRAEAERLATQTRPSSPSPSHKKL